MKNNIKTPDIFIVLQAYLKRNVGARLPIVYFDGINKFCTKDGLCEADTFEGSLKMFLKNEFIVK